MCGALYSTVSALATSYSGMYIWKVPKLTRRRRDAVLGKTVSLYSAPFFTSRHGYKLCLRVYLNGDGSGRGTHVSFFITLMKGEFDPLLPWPFKQTVSLSLLAQDGVSQDIMQPGEDSSGFQMPMSEMKMASGCLWLICICTSRVLHQCSLEQYNYTIRKFQMNGWRLANTSSTNVCVWLFTFCHVAESCCDIVHMHSIYCSTFQRGYNVTLFMRITVITCIRCM